VEDKLFMLADAVLDSKCQKYFAPDKGAPHEISLFGRSREQGDVPVTSLLAAV
jgi:hypothetical protein